MYINSTIAVCDILGFSDLVQNNSLEAVIDGALGWFRRSLYHSVHKNTFPMTGVTLEQTQSDVGIAWFSDTILMYTTQDTDDCLRGLLSSIGWLLFETNMASRTRIRCGIAYGPVYLDQANSIYVGTPIIDAYRLEQRQAWSGGALTESAVQRVPGHARNGQFPDWWLIPWNVPIKKGPPEQTLAINWTLGFHDSPFVLTWSQACSEPTSRDWELRPDVCEKWKNTKSFHEDACEDCKRSPQVLPRQVGPNGL
jgi:hypothetical protein